eukprot:m.657992 g.657992  ORF g.657992 m.657992 type:complete len:60 (-) comp22716_c0_seq32:2157-2336(-)
MFLCSGIFIVNCISPAVLGLSVRACNVVGEKMLTAAIGVATHYSIAIASTLLLQLVCRK